MLHGYAPGLGVDEKSAWDWSGHATMQKAGAGEYPKPYLSPQFQRQSRERVEVFQVMHSDFQQGESIGGLFEEAMMLVKDFQG